ncbi:hypothetical protein L0Y49_04690 [bacterium]|nr:hypothetical protein [bacterium]
MIKNLEQATRVQERRVESGKKGIAKAVRRWMKKNKLRSLIIREGGDHEFISTSKNDTGSASGEGDPR